MWIGDPRFAPLIKRMTSPAILSPNPIPWVTAFNTSLTIKYLRLNFMCCIRHRPFESKLDEKKFSLCYT